MRGLRAALETDDSLWELFGTPLMLWVGMLAYQGIAVDLSLAQTPHDRRSQLFESFVSAMLRRRSGESRYGPKDVIYWLHWLAFALSQTQQTVFLLENIAVNWLPTPRQRRLAKTSLVAVGGVYGLISGVIMRFIAIPHVNVE